MCTGALHLWALIEGCLILRYQYVLLGYAASPNEESSSPIAVVCVVPGSTTGEGALFVRREWQRYVGENHLDYIGDTFDEWATLLRVNPTAMLQVVLELSVGPIRTVKDGECDEHDLVAHVEAFLQGMYRRLA